MCGHALFLNSNKLFEQPEKKEIHFRYITMFSLNLKYTLSLTNYNLECSMLIKIY